MKKLEINNEVVSLRQSVRQARICVINKLIREAKRLRTSHGNEKQLERNKNRADKLLREVFALKRIKDDEISKFGIAKFENLTNILQDPHTDDGTRAMAKVVRYKSMSSRIIEFRETYPDYREQICWRKKKHSRKKEESNVTSSQKGCPEPLSNDANNAKAAACKENKAYAHSNASTCETYSKKRENSNEKCKSGRTIPRELCEKEPENLHREAGAQDVDEQSENGQTSGAVTKVISSQATVKRFTEILQESELKVRNGRCEGFTSEQPTKETREFTRNSDDFFLQPSDATSVSTVILFPRQTNNRCNANENTFASRTRDKKGKLYPRAISEKKNISERQNVNEKICRSRKKEINSENWKKTKCVRDEGKRDVRSTEVAKDEILHPSWAAKKKQQDIMKQGFQGKKIKFDED